MLSLGSLLPPPRVSYRANFRLRGRSIFAALGARPNNARHSRAEHELLLRLAAGARTIVEIGVHEGGSAWALRQAMAPDGHLHLLDTYPLGRLGVSTPFLAAHRLVGTVPRGTVSWHQSTSHAAVRDWDRPIEFLFIDGDHSYRGASLDWEDWSPFVTPDGTVVFHNAREGGPSPALPGVVRLVEEIAAAGEWREIATEGSMVAFARAAGSVGPL
jgi:predicted O-methyltransferase YrrM